MRIINAAQGVPGQKYQSQSGKEVLFLGPAKEPNKFEIANHTGARMVVPGAFRLVETNAEPWRELVGASKEDIEFAITTLSPEDRLALANADQRSWLMDLVLSSSSPQPTEKTFATCPDCGKSVEIVFSESRKAQVYATHKGDGPGVCPASAMTVAEVAQVKGIGQPGTLSTETSYESNDQIDHLREYFGEATTGDDRTEIVKTWHLEHAKIALGDLSNTKLQRNVRRALNNQIKFFEQIEAIVAEDKNARKKLTAMREKKVISSYPAILAKIDELLNTVPAGVQEQIIEEEIQKHVGSNEDIIDTAFREWAEYQSQDQYERHIDQTQLIQCYQLTLSEESAAETLKHGVESWVVALAKHWVDNQNKPALAAVLLAHQMKSERSHELNRYNLDQAKAMVREASPAKLSAWYTQSKMRPITRTLQDMIAIRLQSCAGVETAAQQLNSEIKEQLVQSEPEPTPIPAPTQAPTQHKEHEPQPKQGAAEQKETKQKAEQLLEKVSRLKDKVDNEIVAEKDRSLKQKAIHEGMRARQLDTKIEDCPYEGTNVLSASWKRGWNMQDKAMKNNPPQQVEVQHLSLYKKPDGTEDLWVVRPGEKPQFLGPADHPSLKQAAAAVRQFEASKIEKQAPSPSNPQSIDSLGDFGRVLREIAAIPGVSISLNISIEGK